MGPRKNPGCKTQSLGGGGGGRWPGNQETVESSCWESLGYKAGTMTGSLGYRFPQICLCGYNIFNKHSKREGLWGVKTVELIFIHPLNAEFILCPLHAGSILGPVSDAKQSQSQVPLSAVEVTSEPGVKM